MEDYFDRKEANGRRAEHSLERERQREKERVKEDGKRQVEYRLVCVPVGWKSWRTDTKNRKGWVEQATSTGLPVDCVERGVQCCRVEMRARRIALGMHTRGLTNHCSTTMTTTTIATTWTSWFSHTTSSIDISYKPTQRIFSTRRPLKTIETKPFLHSPIISINLVGNRNFFSLKSTFSPCHLPFVGKLFPFSLPIGFLFGNFI